MPTQPSARDRAGIRVTATRANRADIRRLARRERRAGSLWPIPTAFAAAAVVAAVGMVLLDDRLAINAVRDHFLVGDTNTALTLTSVVATGMLAFLGIVVATTLVAIQLAASQYSPRAVRVFVRSTLTKVCLGIFVATFIFSMITLIAIRSGPARHGGFTPVLSITGVAVLVVATLIAFLVFANGTTRLLRVQYLIERIAQDTRPVLAATFPGDDEVFEVDQPDVDSAGSMVATVSHGVLDAVDVGALAALAEHHGGWIDVTVPIGSYIGVGDAIAITHLPSRELTSSGPGDVATRIEACLLLSNERTLLQDPGFGFRQLVDIASRALSPAVNDPTTAVQAVDRLTELLGRIVNRPDPSGWHADDSGTARVRLRADDFDALFRLAFVEIIRFGADSPQIARRLHASFDSLQATAGSGARPSIDEMRTLLLTATQESSPRAFFAVSEVPDGRGIG